MEEDGCYDDEDSFVFCEDEDEDEDDFEEEDQWLDGHMEDQLSGGGDF